jgi:hypothetical protein
MSKYIDDLMEKHSPSDPYLMSWPQAAAAIREAMEDQRKACRDAFDASPEPPIMTAKGYSNLVSAILGACVEGDE